jgi:hypothetical protein
VSARCFAGIRFGFPQDGQFRIMAMVCLSLILPSRASRQLTITAMLDDFFSTYWSRVTGYWSQFVVKVNHIYAQGTLP